VYGDETGPLFALADRTFSAHSAVDPRSPSEVGSSRRQEDRVGQFRKEAAQHLIQVSLGRDEMRLSLMMGRQDLQEFSVDGVTYTDREETSASWRGRGDDLTQL
jgi:hypothetical protein